MKLRQRPNVYDKFDSVYVLAEFDDNGVMNGRFKIGFSGGATANRIKAYRAGNSRPVKEIYTVLVPQKMGKSIEGKIHREFYENHIPSNGGGIEWFKLSTEELQKVILFMLQFEARNDKQVPQMAFDPTARHDATIAFDRSPFNRDMVPTFKEDQPPKPPPTFIITDPFCEMQAKGGLQDRMHHASILRPIRFDLFQSQ